MKVIKKAFSQSQNRFFGAILLCLCQFAFNQAVFAKHLSIDYDARIEHWRPRVYGEDVKEYSIALDPAVEYQHQASACIKSTTSSSKNSGDFGSMEQKFSAQQYCGKRVRLAGLIKTAELTGGASLWMEVDGADGVIAFDGMKGRAISGTQDWKNCAIVLDVPSKSDSITIGFCQTGSGASWVNNLSFEPVGEDVKCTNRPIEESRHFNDEPEKDPINLNFRSFLPNKPKGVYDWGVNVDGGFRLFRDVDNKCDGSPSVCIEATNPDPSGFALITQNLSPKKYRGKRVEFSAFVKTKDVKDWAGIWMRVDGAANILGFDNMQKRPIKGTADWKRYSVVLDVPEEARVIKYGFMHSGAGTAWMTNAAVETVSNDVPVTGESAKAQKPIAEKLPLQPFLRFQAK